MAATNQDLGSDGSIALGDTVPIVLTVYRSGALYAPTVSAAVAVFKLVPTADDNTAIITKTLGSGITASGSTITVTVTPTDQAGLTATTTFYWACRIKESDGTETTLAGGTLTLTRQAVRTPL